jgi:hypothetical protein
MLRLGEYLAALCIDLVNAITYLIHPAALAEPVEVVKERYYTKMYQLTMVARAHMRRATGKDMPEMSWKYEVALKSPQMRDG